MNEERVIKEFLREFILCAIYFFDLAGRPFLVALHSEKKSAIMRRKFCSLSFSVFILEAFASMYLASPSGTAKAHHVRIAPSDIGYNILHGRYQPFWADNKAPCQFLLLINWQ